MARSGFLPSTARPDEQRLAVAAWTVRCQRRLGELLGWPQPEPRTRAAALWLIADCLPPEEAAETAAGWWR